MTLLIRHGHATFVRQWGFRGFRYMFSPSKWFYLKILFLLFLKTFHDFFFYFIFILESPWVPGCKPASILLVLLMCRKVRPHEGRLAEILVLEGSFHYYYFYIVRVKKINSVSALHNHWIHIIIIGSTFINIGSTS